MDADDLIGQMLGQYELRELVGLGGMGAVYLGYQRALERRVAIKVMQPTFTQRNFAQRFELEAKTAAALQHPHIIQIYDHGIDRGISYIVMPYLSGSTLTERLSDRAENGGGLPSLGETSRLLNQIASALDYAHNEGVIHRDVKTSNIMFDNHGGAYLVDFGIAKLTETPSDLTGTGLGMGSIHYMAPEQVRGKTLTPAADQYALAVVIYAMVTGRMPFEGPTPFEVQQKHINEMPTPPHTFRANTPEAVTLVLERALAKEPTKRFASVTAFAQAFEGAIAGEAGESTNFFTFKIKQKRVPSPTIKPRNPSTPSPSAIQTGTKNLQRRTRPLAWIVGLVIFLLVGSLGALVVCREGRCSPPEPTSVSLAMPTEEVTQDGIETDEPISVQPTPTIMTPSATATSGVTPSPKVTNTPGITPSRTSSPTTTSSATPTLSPTTTSSATATPGITPSRTPRPTATLPAFTDGDFIFDVSRKNWWTLQNMVADEGENRWTVRLDPYLIYDRPINLCLADYSYVSVSLAVPLDAVGRKFEVYYLLNNQQNFSESNVFRTPLKRSAEIQTYFYPISRIATSAGDHLTGIRLDPSDGSNTKTTQVQISDFRLIRANPGTSICSTPTPTATRTPEPLPTSAALSGGVEVTFQDNFLGTQLSSWWRHNYTGTGVRVNNGQLVFVGSNQWGNSIARTNITEGEGILLLFQYEPGTMEFYFDNQQSVGSHREWGIGRNNNKWGVMCYGTTACNSFTLVRDRWYYLLLRVADGGTFYAQIWQKDNPSDYVLNVKQTSADQGWQDATWRFVLQVYSGTVRVETYEELRFPANYEIRNTVSAISTVGVAATPTLSPTATRTPTRTPTRVPPTAQAATIITSVSLPGSFGTLLGCSADWQPECNALKMNYDPEDNVWQASLQLPAGDYEYKAALNRSWDENYGLNALREGPNIPLSLKRAATVTFYYDPKTHWITDSINSVIITAPGSYQSEIGCSSSGIDSGDWDPACLRSWLQDPDGDGTYTLTLNTVRAGDYEVKVAVSENWEENYGLDGVRDGDNIPFSVPENRTAVTFTYNSKTHRLTIRVG